MNASRTSSGKYQSQQFNQLDSGDSKGARTAHRAEAVAIRRGKIRLRIKHMSARRIGLHDREPAKRHTQWRAREDCADAGREGRKEPRCSGEIFPLLGYESHDAEREVQAARLDDDGGVEPLDWWVVCEPGGSERLYGAAEVGMVADGEREEVGWAGSCRRGLLLGAGVP